jgi:hypothetical protein
VPPPDDAAAQRELNATLERFRGDARVALGLRPTDDAAAARRAFMALCKVYHPAKFARFAPSTVRLSNEVFLTIRRAYESIAPPPSALSRAAAGSTAPSERSSGGLPRVGTTTPPTGVTVTPRATTPPPRPATPNPAPPNPPTASTPRAAPPTTSREPLDPQLDRALALAAQKKWTEARALFAELATRQAGDPRYRAYVHLARGWEAYVLGKDAEARAEWQRASACDPRNDLVKFALESTGMAK